jgi:hypothetical protein
MRFRTVVLIACTAAAVVTLGAQGPRRDGKWEVTMTMDMPGMPMPPMKTIQCVTKEEANDPAKAVPRGGPGGRGRGDSDCKVVDSKIEGAKMTYTMKCTTPQPMDITAEMEYGADTYTGTMKMEGGGRGTMTIKYDGKRLGDCEK